mmetsp:Transcript_39526/g.64027  ORF Transcript_39526/g.64027 Transcript_39526/m.64027 type:complete len:107 (-) Transcript_39526:1516-1836(-)
MFALLGLLAPQAPQGPKNAIKIFILTLLYHSTLSTLSYMTATHCFQVVRSTLNLTSLTSSNSLTTPPRSNVRTFEISPQLVTTQHVKVKESQGFTNSTAIAQTNTF